MEKTNIFEKLNEAEIDPKVKIIRIKLFESTGFEYHAAEIAEKVQSHVHFKGDEIYHIIQGHGKMLQGKVNKKGKEYLTEWEEPFEVKEGDVFRIPAGHAHCLENTGDSPMVIVFVCPRGLLENDRIVVNNAPEAAVKH